MAEKQTATAVGQKPRRLTLKQRLSTFSVTKEHISLAWLLVLYLVQGIPFGYQILVLPILLRHQGVSLTLISLSAVLSLPWSVKFLWSPLVDSYGGPGRRKLWITPLLTALCILEIIAFFVLSLYADEGEEAVGAMPLAMAGLFCLNFLSATLDIAVDGLAIDVLEDSELGLGNSAQVVGFKLGMLAGGPLLHYVTGGNMAVTFLLFAVCTVPALVYTILSREPSSAAGRAAAQAARRSHVSALTRTLHALKDALLAKKGAKTLVIFIATYKAGEQIADVLFKPFVVDTYGPDTAMWLGTYSLLPSMIGSFLGGYMASRYKIMTTVLLFCVTRTITVGLEWALVAGHLAGQGTLVAVSWTENITGGALTTAVFALMMESVDKTVGASHYTLLSAVEVFGKMVVGQMAGPMADNYGYGVAFAVATLFSVLHLFLFPRLFATVGDRPEIKAVER